MQRLHLAHLLCTNVLVFLWIFPSRPGPNPLPDHCHLHLLVGGRRHLRLPGGGQQWEGLQGETLGLPDAAHNWLWTHFDIRDWNTFETALSRSTKSPTTTTRFHEIFSRTKHSIPCLLMRFHLKVIEVLMEERKPHKSGPQVKQKISEI